MKAIDFLHRWGAENIEPSALSKGQPEAERLAAQCIADAAKENLSEEDLEIAAGEDLISYVYEGMENSAAAEARRLASKDE